MVRTGSHHNRLCVELVESLDARLLLEAGAVRQRAIDECSVSEIGANDSRLGLEECSPPVGHTDRPAAPCSFRVE